MNKWILILVLGLFSAEMVAPDKAFANDIKKTWQPAVATTQAPVQDMKVYPNPTTGKLFLTLQGFKAKQIELQVINVIGNVVLHEKFYETEDQTTKTLDLSRFNKGLYYVKMQSDKYSVMRKVFLN